MSSTKTGLFRISVDTPVQRDPDQLRIKSAEILYKLFVYIQKSIVDNRAYHIQILPLSITTNDQTTTLNQAAIVALIDPADLAVGEYCINGWEGLDRVKLCVEDREGHESYIELSKHVLPITENKTICLWGRVL